MRLERLGIPTVTVVLDVFAPAARAHAAIHGHPDLPLVVVPRTFLDDPDDERIYARDRAMFDAILEAITLP